MDRQDAALDVEIAIVGAGINGIHLLYELKNAGFSVRLLERGEGVGGTWFWNRYPGARFDSESYTYGYFFSSELKEEWEWKEHFAPQPETERYLNHVVDRFGLRGDIELGAAVESAVFDDEVDAWTVSYGDGRTLRARYVVTAVGQLSEPYFPPFPGRESFQGELYHTGLWPSEPVEFEGKRVAVIGVGSSGVQIVPEIADRVESLTVYQRTANWNAPLNNTVITPEEQAEIKAGYDELLAACRVNPGGFMHPILETKTFEASEEERAELYEQMWQSRGFAKMFSNYSDMMLDPDANKAFCEFVAAKIRERVDDPELAEKLIPKDHGYGMKRPPMENGYYEAFNRPNVSLVDLKETPIEEITATGIRTSEGEREFDVVIFATGFDAVTGPLVKMGIEGSGGTTLAEAWKDGPRTYLGLQTAGFPNLLMVGSAHSVYGNIPRSVEIQVAFVTRLLTYMREHGFDRIEADPEAQREWTEHVYETAKVLLVAETAWYVGSNIPGKSKGILMYVGGNPAYETKTGEVAAAGYDGFVFSEAPVPAAIAEQQR